MPTIDLKSRLVDAVERYSTMSFEVVDRMLDQGDRIHEEYDSPPQAAPTEWSQLLVSPVQKWTVGTKQFIDVLVAVHDSKQEIGVSLLFCSDGTVEKPTQIFLHSESGLPKPIGNL
jgi:hypothetical protein